jgi:hypothetical protein
MPRKPKTPANTITRKNPRKQNARYWIATILQLEEWFNGTIDPTKHQDFRYMAFQVEECPKTKKWHVQLYIEFYSQINGATLQNLLGRRCHIEVAIHREAARAYSMKEESRIMPFEEYGTWDPETHQGYRTDLTMAKYKIMQHENFLECARDDGLDKITRSAPKWINTVLLLKKRRIRDPPKVIVYYGPTQTGKTARCHQSGEEVHELTYDGHFFDYDGQDTVLLDEFDKNPIPFYLILKLLDRYPFRVNIKHGYCYWTPKTIYITSTEHPNQWYLGHKGYKEEYWPQLKRRITTIYYTGTDYKMMEPDDCLPLDGEESPARVEKILEVMTTVPATPITPITPEGEEESEDLFD